MTSRERVLKTIGHAEPDRVPYNLRPDPVHVRRLSAEFGEVAFAEHFGHDVRYVGLTLASAPAGVADVEWTPRPEAEAVAAVAQATRELQARGLAVCSAYSCGIYEQAKDWLGDVPTMTGPYDDPAAFGRTLDRIVEWKSAIYGAYASAGVDLVWIGDDLGTQRSLVMSPQQYRAWYRPRHEEIIKHLRAIRPEVKIAFHCCGHVTPLVGDLIEIGVEVLEAVQSEAMSLAELKREYGRDLTFWGGIGAQSILSGTREDVWSGVAETLETMAPGGGYIAAPCHTLTAEVPWENVVALQEAVRALGDYAPEGGLARRA
jgi:uroporphyrinogen decarboxylase